MFKFEAVDSLDAVPEEFRYAYGKTPNADGKFEVSADAKPFVTAYLGVNSALETERGKVRNLNSENATRRTALKPYEDLVSELGITVEGDDGAGAIKAHVATLTDKVKGGEAFKGNLTKIKDESEKRIKAITDQHKAEMDAMQRTLSEYLIDREALAALAKNKAKNGGRVLMPHVQSKLKVIKGEDGKYVVRAVGDNGEILYNNSAQPMGVEDVVAQIRTNPDYAFAFESEGAGGTGSQPGSSTRPVVKPVPGADQMNSTQKIAAGLDQMTKK